MLLTIAIPTFNRAPILSVTLAALFEEIKNLNEYVQIVLSDNCSNDGTYELLQAYKDRLSDFNIVINRQENNTGYYGNFKKCRELSIGNYFWLLSDNEKLCKGVVYEVVKQLKNGNKFSFLFLNNTPNKEMHFPFYFRITSVENFLNSNHAYKITLISSVIIYNSKENDDYIYQHYQGNLFLGFAYLIESLKYSHTIGEIYGNVYESLPVKVSFDIFKAWTKDITECLKLLKKYKVVSLKTVDAFINNYLEKVVYNLILTYKVKRRLHNMNFGHIGSIEHQIRVYYSRTSVFEELFVPLFRKSRAELYMMILFQKIISKLYKISSHSFPAKTN